MAKSDGGNRGRTSRGIEEGSRKKGRRSPSNSMGSNGGGSDEVEISEGDRLH